jgi:hypothetical protein
MSSSPGPTDERRPVSAHRAAPLPIGSVAVEPRGHPAERRERATLPGGAGSCIGQGCRRDADEHRGVIRALARRRHPDTGEQTATSTLRGAPVVRNVEGPTRQNARLRDGMQSHLSRAHLEDADFRRSRSIHHRCEDNAAVRVKAEDSLLVRFVDELQRRRTRNPPIGVRGTQQLAWLLPRVACPPAPPWSRPGTRHSPASRSRGTSNRSGTLQCATATVVVPVDALPAGSVQRTVSV